MVNVIPSPTYLSYELRYEDVDELVPRLTEALVNMEDKTGKYKYKIADGRTIDSINWNFWEWPQAIGLNGLFNYYCLNPDSAQGQETLKIIKTWYAARAKEGGTTKNINTMSVLYTLTCLMEQELNQGGIFTAEEKALYEGWIDEWGEFVMNDLPRTEQGGFQHITLRLENKNQLWDDTLMMTVIPLTKIGLLLNRPHYVEEAKYQFLIHSQYLMDTPTGLWYHGWEFDGQGGGHNYAKALWGRGNCWITLAIPMFLDLVKLPTNDPVCKSLVSILERQVDGLLRYQDASTGLWRTLINDESSYVETSATAGFAAGMLMAVRLGYLDRNKYLPTALSALKACILEIQPNGQVANVSKGTPVGHDLDFYKTIPIVPVPYGQSLVIVALGEWLRLEKYSRR